MVRLDFTDDSPRIESFSPKWVAKSKVKMYQRKKDPRWKDSFITWDDSFDDYWIGCLAEWCAEKILTRSALTRDDGYWHINQEREHFLPLDYLIKPPLSGPDWKPRLDVAGRRWNGWGLDVKGMRLKKNTCEIVQERWRTWEWMIKAKPFDDNLSHRPRFIVFVWVDPDDGEDIHGTERRGTNRFMIAGYLRIKDLDNMERRECTVTNASREYQIDNYVIPVRKIRNPAKFADEVWVTMRELLQ